ncbi:MAG: acyl-CoA dehydrogenase family protein [Deltaproteobacteria bacterium]|nr:acyl-CoA dehydrogenase family protein [Deltaproteobacteria bacterium]MBW2150783.1 acyl-CoA dehydrogenase family protein [Deltaproteobacteria bacterium]
MDFNYTKEQQMIKDAVRDFAEKEVKPAASEIDRKDEFPWEIYKKTAELGILAMTLPPEYGGSGGRYGQLVHCGRGTAKGFGCSGRYSAFKNFCPGKRIA